MCTQWVGKGEEANVTETPAEPKTLYTPDEPRITSAVSTTNENASSISVTSQFAETASETVLLQDRRMQSPQLPADLISTPEVQCVIVEHIVKSNDVAISFQLVLQTEILLRESSSPSFWSQLWCLAYQCGVFPKWSYHIRYPDCEENFGESLTGSG